MVIDPSDGNHVISDSVDNSGIWETQDGGQNWKRSVADGASFANASTRVAYLKDPMNESEWVLVSKVGKNLQGPILFKVPLANPSAGFIALDAWDGGSYSLETDPIRPGRIIVVDLAPTLPNVIERFKQGLFGISLDAGKTWTRIHVGDNRVHIPSKVAFAQDGSILVASVMTGSIDSFAAIFADYGKDAIRNAVRRYVDTGIPIPSKFTDPYNIDVRPQLLKVDPFTGDILSQIDLPEPVVRIGTHPFLRNVIWVGSRLNIYRSGDNGLSGNLIPIATTSHTLVLGPPTLTLVGMTLAIDPRDNAETIFLSINGANGFDRGIYRGKKELSGTWVFERVSPGARPTFFDWPKSSVAIAKSNPMLLYAPYAEDGMWKSEAFGDPGSFEVVNHGLTGYNIFDVTEDPRDPTRVFATAQNVVRINHDRVASSQWDDRFLSLAAPTCNVRGGVQADPIDSDRWLAGAGGGAAGCLNGGVWLTQNRGMIWVRVLGRRGIDNFPSNPQVVELLQHPSDPDWVLAASAQFNTKVNSNPSGNAGLFVSTQRGDLGSWTEVIDRGDAWVLLPLPTGGVLAGGDWGLSLLIRSGDAVTVRNLPGSWSGDSVRAAAISGNSIIIGTTSGKLYRTPKDFNLGWEFLHDIGDDITDLATSPLRPGEIYAAMGGISRKNLGIWRSLDGGDTWTNYSEGLESSELVVFDLEISRLGDRLYAGTLGGMAIRPLP
jgi:hypothetical protein